MGVEDNFKENGQGMGVIPPDPPEPARPDASGKKEGQSGHLTNAGNPPGTKEPSI